MTLVVLEYTIVVVCVAVLYVKTVEVNKKCIAFEQKNSVPQSKVSKQSTRNKKAVVTISPSCGYKF
jgi:hypothetical protein